jgi:hypothetical protein
MKRSAVLLLVIYLAFATAHFLAPAPSAIDFGRWRIVAIESDDWGTEAWVPDLRAAQVMADQGAKLGPKLGLYASSSLETAQDVDSLAALLAEFQDSDGLPAVLQANTIMAAIDVDSCGTDDFRLEGNPVLLRSPGSCGAYLRVGLNEAVDAARDEGVWRAELHGLTHFDLGAYESAVANASSLTVRARSVGAVAFPHWLTLTELGSGNLDEARAFASLSCRLFEERFGRRPQSVIAPDYTWGEQDEVAWKEQGLQVVQAKREQIDPALMKAEGNRLWRRVRKVLQRWKDRRKNRFVYLERNVRLEPYGDFAPDCLAGSEQAAKQVMSAWRRGEPAIVEAHRLQFSHLDPRVSRAGRLQLRRFLSALETRGEVRYCVDVEVAQLRRRGWSIVRRGPWTIVRNYTERPLLLDFPHARSQPLAPGTYIYTGG